MRRDAAGASNKISNETNEYETGKENYDQGKSDGASGADYNPPEGTGWVQDVENNAGGTSDAHDDYKDGYEDGKGK